MALTNNQISNVNRHPNIAWLKNNHTRLPISSIRAKIAEAIRAKLSADSVTESNIRDVANNNTIFYGQQNAPAYLRDTVGRVAAAAVSEVEGHDVAMAQALRMIFNRTANGRTAPGTTGINHIHVQGNAQLNILFDATSYVVYGVVNGHMDSGMTSSIRNQADRVGSRKNQPGTVEIKVVGSQISRT
jgi:hypothetical protein